MSPLEIVALVIAAPGVLLCIAGAIANRRRKRAGPRGRGAEAAILGGVALLLAGMFALTLDLVAPDVQGTVLAITHGKGNQIRLRLATADGTRTILGERGTEGRCPTGSLVHKPAWTTAYTCNGASVGTASVGIWFGLGLYVLFAGLAAAAALGDLRGKRAGGHGPSRGRSR